MKAKIICAFLMAGMMAFVPVLDAPPLWEGVSAADNMPEFSGGQGTETDPWLISDVDDLLTLAETVNNGDAASYDAEGTGCGNYFGYYFEQTADLDLTGVDWDPIGYSGNCYFSGHYDGGNHYILNAVSDGLQDSSGYSTSGIFGWLYQGSVENLHVRNADFQACGNKAYSYVGGISGIVYDATVSNCTVSDSRLESRRDPDNNNCVGGIAGYSTGGTFINCGAQNNQVVGMAYAGGFVGEIDDDFGTSKTSFTCCYVLQTTVTSSSQNVQDLHYAGGFAGTVTSGSIEAKNCYVYDVQLSISAPDNDSYKYGGIWSGGIWEKNSSFTCTNCYYSSCTMTGIEFVWDDDGAVEKTP